MGDNAPAPPFLVETKASTVLPSVSCNPTANVAFKKHMKRVARKAHNIACLYGSVEETITTNLPNQPPPPVLLEREEEWEVDGTIDFNVICSQRRNIPPIVEFRVRWKGA
jgi:hypothetical protein